MTEGPDLVVTPSWGMFPVKRYVVRGKVQGVGFRWWTHRHACSRRLVGHVFNRSDGAVEVVLAGEAMFMGEVEELLAVGPPGAKVESVEVSDVPPGSIPVPHAFEIVKESPESQP